MNRLVVFIIAFMFAGICQAQVPTNCLQIETILVDACGGPEGENEMVRFQVGNTPLVLADFSADWPNNVWQGLCQDGTTATKVANWNTTITECGLLLEPVGGIIPAGKRVILVSSTNVIPTANSFAGLSDTVYVIFQCSGNTNGHFANWGTGLRTLILFEGACSDTATYDRALLEDQFGINIAADGATVVFDWPGNPDYINVGCTAPVVPVVVDAGADQTGFCPGDTVDLTGNTQGSFSGFNWTGESGTMINSTSVTNAFYVIGVSENFPIQIIFSATNCNGSVNDTMFLFASPSSQVSITPAGPIDICNGDTITLTAIGPGPFSWNTSASTASIQVTNSGNYIVTQTTTCGTSSDTVVVTNNGSAPVATITPLGPTTLCSGASVTLQGSGGTSFLWNGSDPNPNFLATLAGNYTLIVSNACGSDTTNIILTGAPDPFANISPSSPINLCAGNVDITVNGIGNFLWSTGDTTNTVNFTSPGNYFVVASNICGSDTAFFVIQGGAISAGFTAIPTSGNGPLPVSFTNTSSGADSYLWIFGDGGTSTDINPSHTYNQPGIYNCMLITSNSGGCSDTAYITITVDSCLYAIKIPNVFTPDGNLLNDEFAITATCVDEFVAYIYDRWGLKVFEYTDVTYNWNGETLTGTKVSSGVYHYVILIKDFNGDSHQYPGFIQVFD